MDRLGLELRTRLITIYRFLRQLNFDDSISRATECDVLLFCHDVDRPLSLAGQAYSPLLDSVCEDLQSRGLRCLSIAHPGSILTGNKAYNSPLSMNRSFNVYRIVKKIYSLVSLHFLHAKSPYELLFERTKAKVAITIGCSDELCKTARRLGVVHMELIHGIGFTTIPWAWDQKGVQHLPQIVLTLDMTSAITFDKLNQNDVLVKCIPNPFWKRFLGKNHVKVPKEWMPNELKGSQFNKVILVSLQYGYAGDHAEFVEFSGILKNGLFFDEIERLITEHTDVYWRFRFHPVHMRSDNYGHLIRFMDDFVAKYPNVEWRESSKLPFPSVAVSCDGNITMSSMSCYDAAAFGLKSLMLCPTLQPGMINESFFSDLESEGYVVKARPDYLQIKEWVLSAEKGSPRLSNIYDEPAWEDVVCHIMQVVK